MHFARNLLLTVMVFAACLTGTATAQVRVISSGGFRAPLDAVLPEFQKTSGITVTVSSGQSQGDTPNTIANQLRRGVQADVVIMSREGLDGLIADGRIVKGTDVNLAQTPLGVSVRAGAPKPDIRTVEAFKKTLLNARAVTFPSSTTGIYMVAKLFPRLGIADAVANKTTNVGVAAVAKGDADIALQPVSELLHVPGTTFVGTIPAEIQYISVFSAAIVGRSQHVEESKRLVAFLMSERVLSALKNSGMDRFTARSTR